VKKALSLLASLALMAGAMVLGASAEADGRQVAVVASGEAEFNDSAGVQGDMLMMGGTLESRKDASPVTGSVYTLGRVEIESGRFSTVEYPGTAPHLAMKDYAEVPAAGFFAGNKFSTGTKDLSIGKSGNDQSDGYTLDENAYIDTLTVKNGLEMNIEVKSGEIRILRVKKLDIKGAVNVVGGGRVILYVEDLKGSSQGALNPAGSAQDLTVVFYGKDDEVTIQNFSKLHANIIAPKADVELKNTDMTGNIYTGGDFEFEGSGTLTGMVFAPKGEAELAGSAVIRGLLVTGELDMTGDSKVIYGPVSGLPEDVENAVTGGSTDPSEPTDPEKPVDPDTPSGGGDAEMVTISVRVARRMSIRLEDGRILKDGDTFEMPKGGTIKFQMCTNNWDTDTYDDNGNGIAGTKVYTFTYNPKGDNALRTDTNTYFMAVRYHFTKGDYNKQTGIEQVLSTPLESLSVNLPLGSTISSDAYIRYGKVDTRNVFVETAEDKTICYTDYYWNY
jgi:hypothetical protein